MATIRAEEAHGETQAGAVLGTYAYMPPEQASGTVERIDRRSDVFGLGAILCNVLTGQPPYTGEPDAVREQAEIGRTGDALRRLDTCGADAELIALAKRCLAVPPEDRPAGGAAVAETMATYFTAVQERLRTAEIARAQAETEAVAEKRQARAERRRRRATLLMAASLLLLVSGAAAFGLWYQNQRANAPARSRRVAPTRNAT